MNLQPLSSSSSSSSSSQHFTLRPLNTQLRLGITGKRGASSSLFNEPWGITFDSLHQHIIISDAGNNRLQFFSRSTLQYLKSIGGNEGTQLGQFKSPKGLCIQPFTRHLLVSDSQNNRVQVFSLDNAEFGGDKDMNEEVKFQSLYTTDCMNGKNNETKKKFNRPGGICCGVDGSMMVADFANNRIQVLDVSGRFLSSFGSQGNDQQEFMFPFDVCFLSPPFSPSSSSLFLVTDNGNKRISVWNTSSSSSSLSSFSSLSKPQHRPLDHIPVPNYTRGVCVDLKGYVYVSCGGWSDEMNVVEVREPRMNWRWMETLGGEGCERGDAPGKFNHPTGMCVDDTNTLMVADCFNQRIQFFNAA